MEELVFYNLVYFLFAFFLIYPPTEVQLVGFSIPSLFASVLGSEELFFVHYQISRISLTIIIHSLLPLGYYLFMGLSVADLNLFNLHEASIFWRVYLLFSVSFAVGLITLVYFWKLGEFENHPIATYLRKTLPPSSTSSWKSVANQINIEYRRVDKFSTGSSFYNRIYVTDNWLIKVNLYSLNLCQHDNLELVLTHSTELNLSIDGSPHTQLLNILVKPIANEGGSGDSFQKPFYIKLNSLEYKDFNDKINKPIQAACDIVIKQSLPDQFLDSFQSQVNLNRSFRAKRDVMSFFYFFYFLVVVFN